MRSSAKIASWGIRARWKTGDVLGAQERKCVARRDEVFASWSYCPAFACVHSGAKVAETVSTDLVLMGERPHFRLHECGICTLGPRHYCLY